MANPTSPFPATVQFGGLPLGTTPSGLEIFAAIQTTAGFGRGVQLTINQMTAALNLTGSFAVSSVLQNAVVYGQGGSTVGVLGPASVTGTVLLSNGSVAAPTFGVVGLSVGGLNTNVVASTFGVVLNGTSSPFAVVGVAGQALVGQNATNFPVWEAIGGDLTLSAAGTAMITPNAITFAKSQQILGNTLIGNPTGAAANIIATTRPSLGTGGATGSLGLAGSNTSVVTLAPGTTAFTSYNFFFPTSMGASGNLLSSQGAGNAMTFTAVPVSTTLIDMSRIFYPPAPYAYDEPVNFGFTPSVSGAGILTVTITDENGNTPTATSPILIPFSANAGTAIVTWASVTSALSFTTVASATFGVTNSSTAFRLWLALFLSGNTVFPAIVNCSGPGGGTVPGTVFGIPAYGAQALTSMNTTSNSLGVFYGNSGLPASPYRLAGFMEWGNGVASIGTFSTTPTLCSYFGPDTPRPGAVLQVVAPQFGSLTSVTVTSNLTFATTNITGTITQISSTNPVRVTAMSSVNCASATSIMVDLIRTVGGQIGGGFANVSGTGCAFQITALDFPYAASSTYQILGLLTQAGGTAFIPSTASDSASLIMEELMG